MSVCVFGGGGGGVCVCLFVVERMYVWVHVSVHTLSYYCDVNIKMLIRICIDMFIKWFLTLLGECECRISTSLTSFFSFYFDIVHIDYSSSSVSLRVDL